jgi:hypothetical protein
LYIIAKEWINLSPGSCTFSNDFFFMGLEFELRVSHLQSRHFTLSHTSSSFCSGYFGDGVWWTICPDWPHMAILSVSASQIARITDMSHQHPAWSRWFWWMCFTNHKVKPLLYL